MNPEAPQHECAVIGILCPGEEVSKSLYYGLQAMQNRGQEGSGIATFRENGELKLRKALGLVNAVFTEENITDLNGDIGVGHNRYGTTGSNIAENTQPLIIQSELGPFVVAHNGNAFNAPQLRSDLQSQGESFESTSDSEVIGKLIAYSSGRSFVEKIKSATPKIQGAYTLVIATPDSMIGVRDPWGTWPLSLGSFNSHGYMLASETNGIEKAGGKFIRDIENGEIIVIDREGAPYSDNIERQKEALCSFEYFYFGDPYSKYLGRRVEGARFDMGRLLYEEHPAQADWVIPVPETGRPAAEGFSYASKIPVRGALVRNRWMGRTFIEPDQRLRELGAALKYGALAEVIEGNRLVIEDDSIVRGTTTKKTIQLIRDAGAKEIHLRITAPPIIERCHFGIDTAKIAELIAAHKSVSEIKDFLEVDSLGFLSLEGGMKAIGTQLKDRLCTSCFTGKYNMMVPAERDKYVLERL